MDETSFSLLERLRTQPDDAAWKRLYDLYHPLIRSWLLRDPSFRNDVDDLVQEIMAVLVRRLPDFERQRTGSFRRWLRAITLNCLRNYERRRRHQPQPLADSATTSLLAQLEDPQGALSQQWEREHDQHVMRRLLVLIEPDFQLTTWQAFCRTALQGEATARVAADLRLSPQAVLLAKSRVLNRLRQEARGLLE